MTWLLENERLKLTIEEPGRLYQGSRFDRTGNISQVILDGRISFCTTERKENFNAGSHGQGLYNEFGINKPIGYEDCREGEAFLKVGVGLLTRNSRGPYDFFTSYPVKPFEIEVDHCHNFIRFTVMPDICRGYAVKMVKSISLSESLIHIDYKLENTGIKAVHTNEYCHNFISINHTDVDTNYSLKVGGTIPEFSKMTEAVNPENAVTIGKNGLDFRFSPFKDIFFSPFALFTGKGEWEITHSQLRSGISEQTDFIPAMMNVWGATHVLSPELFTDINIEPGGAHTWRRTFKFYTF